MLFSPHQRDQNGTIMWHDKCFHKEVMLWQVDTKHLTKSTYVLPPSHMSHKYQYVDVRSCMGLIKHHAMKIYRGVEV
jgi:hypothetical protein